MASEYSPYRRRFLGRLIGAGALGLAGVTWDQHDEADALTVTHTDVKLSAWPKGAPPLTLGFLADTHCHDWHAVRRAGRAAVMLMKERPDAVFLGGDFLMAWPSIWSPRAADALAPLGSAPEGVFCVMGNHDWAGGGEKITPREMRRVGFTFLRNQSAPLKTRPDIWVVGLDDMYFHHEEVSLALEGVPPDVCKLLLIHEPDYADQAPSGFAMQLSGHSHGGQIRIPLLPPLHLPKYSHHYPEGLQQGPHYPIYTTRGIGTTGPPIRLFCPPEVTVLHLHGD